MANIVGDTYDDSGHFVSGHFVSDWLRKCTADPTECKQQTENDSSWMNGWTYGGCDNVYDFANNNGMTFRGHNFVWGCSGHAWCHPKSISDLCPSKSSCNKELVNNFAKAYVRNMASKYKGKAKMWDVVNEAVCDNGELPTTEPGNVKLPPSNDTSKCLGDGLPSQWDGVSKKPFNLRVTPW